MLPVLPDFGGSCISELLGALQSPVPRPVWIPEPARHATQIVLLALDGLGWEQLRSRPDVAPTLCGMAGGPITSVAPTTTATALTSITTGKRPAEHGVVGYRVRVNAGEGPGEVLNVLRWSTPSGDARHSVVPEEFQAVVPFGGQSPPVISRGEFFGSGFTTAHLRGGRLQGWRVTSTIVVDVAHWLRAGEPFVYAYYDGVDRVAHEYGLGEHYDAELRAADRLVADLIDVLPAGAALVVTADHGQVEVGDHCVVLDQALLEDVVMLSGEGRFRWLHCQPGRTQAVLEEARRLYGHQAWVHSADEIAAAGWFGGPLPEHFATRLGDVAVVAFEPVAFVDPNDSGPLRLVARHGSLTPEEVWVPLLSARG